MEFSIIIIAQQCSSLVLGPAHTGMNLLKRHVIGKLKDKYFFVTLSPTAGLVRNEYLHMHIEDKHKA